MSDEREKLQALLRRLKEAQHHALAVAAASMVIPTNEALRKIADLENTIGAVEIARGIELVSGRQP